MKKRGDFRTDGFRFWAYEKRPDLRGFREKWLRPEVYERSVERVKRLRKLWIQRQRTTCRPA